MPFPWLAAVKVIPWLDIVRHAPAVVDAADRLLSESRRRKPKPSGGASELEDLKNHVAALEQRLEDNAVVVKELAEQVERLSNASQVVVARLRFAWWLAAAGFALAFIAIVLAVSLRP